MIDQTEIAAVTEPDTSVLLILIILLGLIATLVPILWITNGPLRVMRPVSYEMFPVVLPLRCLSEPFKNLANNLVKLNKEAKASKADKWHLPYLKIDGSKNAAEIQKHWHRAAWFTAGHKSTIGIFQKDIQTRLNSQFRQVKIASLYPLTVCFLGVFIHTLSIDFTAFDPNFSLAVLFADSIMILAIGVVFSFSVRLVGNHYNHSNSKRLEQLITFLQSEGKIHLKRDVDSEKASKELKSHLKQEIKSLSLAAQTLANEHKNWGQTIEVISRQEWGAFHASILAFTESKPSLDKLRNGLNSSEQLFAQAEKTLASVDNLVNIGSKIEDNISQANQLQRYLASHFEELELSRTASLGEIGQIDQHFRESLKSLRSVMSEQISALKSIVVQEEAFLKDALQNRRKALTELTNIKPTNNSQRKNSSKKTSE